MDIPVRQKYSVKIFYSDRKLGNPLKDYFFVLKHFVEIYNNFKKHGYFQEAFGEYCTDGHIEGYSARDLKGSIENLFNSPNYSNRR